MSRAQEPVKVSGVRPRSKSRSHFSPLFLLFGVPEAPQVLYDAQNTPTTHLKKFKTLTREEAYLRMMELQKNPDPKDAVVVMCQMLMLLLDNDDRLGKCLDNINIQSSEHRWSNKIVFGTIFFTMGLAFSLIFYALHFHIGG